jgi:hypothetical protein
VTLTASSSPAGPTMSFSPSRLSGPGSATLTIATTRSVRAGNYTITVTAGGSAGSSASATYTLTALQNTRTN